MYRAHVHTSPQDAVQYHHVFTTAVQYHHVFHVFHHHVFRHRVFRHHVFRHRVFRHRVFHHHHIGVDGSAAIAACALDIVQANNLSKHQAGPITIVHGRLEQLGHAQLQLQGPVDVLVSEWMGYGLLFETMLDSVLAARDRCVRPPVCQTVGTWVLCAGGLVVYGVMVYGVWKATYDIHLCHQSPLITTQVCAARWCCAARYGHHVSCSSHSPCAT